MSSKNEAEKLPCPTRIQNRDPLWVRILVGCGNYSASFHVTFFTLNYHFLPTDWIDYFNILLKDSPGDKPFEDVSIRYTICMYV